MEETIETETQPVVEQPIEQQKENTIQVQYGNIEMIKLRLLDSLVANTNEIIRLLKEKKE